MSFIDSSTKPFRSFTFAILWESGVLKGIYAVYPNFRSGRPIRMAKLLITGGDGFIDSAVMRFLIADTDWQILSVDKLIYAVNLSSLISIGRNKRYCYAQVDIFEHLSIEKLCDHYQPEAVMNLGDESHVDRSITGPAAFIETNKDKAIK